MGYGILNLGSLILGLVAWALPVINLAKRNKTSNKSWVILAFTSISACAVSLYLQILYSDYLVYNEDWSALMDTQNAVSRVSSVLLIITIVLNIITMVSYKKNNGE